MVEVLVITLIADLILHDLLSPHFLLAELFLDELWMSGVCVAVLLKKTTLPDCELIVSTVYYIHFHSQTSLLFSSDSLLTC